MNRKQPEIPPHGYTNLGISIPNNVVERLKAKSKTADLREAVSLAINYYISK